MRKCLILTLVIVSIFSVSCTNKKNIIPRNDLVQLLIDLHISDAIATNGSLNELFNSPDSATIYGYILDKHGFTKAQMESSLEYYNHDPKVLTEIYNEVFAELTKKSEEIKAVYALFTSPLNKTIFQSERLPQRNDSISKPIVFDFPIDSSGIYLISANVKLTTDDGSINPRIVAYFYNPLSDTPDKRQFWNEIPMLKSKYSRNYDLIDTLDTNSLTHLKIIFAANDNLDSNFVRKIDVTKLTVFKYSEAKK